MLTLHPQYFTNEEGAKLVALPVNEFNTILEELDELDDIKLYDDSKKEDDGHRVLFSDYLKSREAKNG